MLAAGEYFGGSIGLGVRSRRDGKSEREKEGCDIRINHAAGVAEMAVQRMVAVAWLRVHLHSLGQARKQH